MSHSSDVPADAVEKAIVFTRKAVENAVEQFPELRDFTLGRHLVGGDSGRAHRLSTGPVARVVVWYCIGEEIYREAGHATLFDLNGEWGRAEIDIRDGWDKWVITAIRGTDGEIEVTNQYVDTHP